MWMFITSKNKYLSNDMNIFGTCSIPLRQQIFILHGKLSYKIPKREIIPTQIDTENSENFI